MKIGITGGKGFIGWHLCCYLKSLGDAVSEIRIADREEFDSGSLEAFVDGLDAVVHLAGVNRAENQELVDGNIEPASKLVEALESTEPPPVVVYSSSTHAVNPANAYGEGKSRVNDILGDWAQRKGARYIQLIIPHVFGEYGRPYYNSAVNTFAHQIANGEAPSIRDNGQLELVHVQDLVEQLYACILDGESGSKRIEGYPITVMEVAERLQVLSDTYHDGGHLPCLDNSLDRCLFNTLRAAIPHQERLTKLVKHSDNRGWLVETVRADSGGQCFVSTTRPGITRGNHFHLRKVERFLVLSGKGRILLRKLFSDEVITYDLDGSEPAFVDIPTLHTHSITNVGDSELITLFWADELFDPESPDTFFEEV